MRKSGSTLASCPPEGIPHQPTGLRAEAGATGISVGKSELWSLKDSEVGSPSSVLGT